MARNPSQDCLALIKESEGLHRKLPDGNIEAYADPVRVWTIGYGSIFHIDVGRPVKRGDVITKTNAARWLQVEVDEKADAVNTLCKVDLTQGMFDALVSFAYNVGTETKGLKGSTLLKKLNSKDYEGAAREFGRWIHGDGKVLPGLVIRRNKEEALFRRDGFPGTITPTADTTFPDTPWQEPKLPLQINRTLVMGSSGEECFILNCALGKLGYLADGIQPGKYTSVTEEAIEWFQDENDLEVDGKFGAKTKAALTMALTNAVRRVPPPMLERVYCRLTRTGTTAYAGLEKLLLEFVDPKGRVLAKLDVISGAPGAQEFRSPEDPLSFPMNLEPIPQARYTIGDIDFAGGKDNYIDVHFHETNGIGPVWVPLIKTRPDDRDNFGFHMDWNRSDSPGSAGCVCVGTEPELKNLVALLRRYDPRDLFVDWGIR